MFVSEKEDTGMGIITLYICLICLLLLFIFLCYVVKNRKMKIWIHGGLCIFLILLVAIPVGFYWANHQQNQLRITETTQPEDIMRHIVETNRDTILSVGIWQDGSEEKYLYTVNGKQEFVPYTYQIGSITKTFTGAMIAYEEEKGKISLEEGEPPLELLVTHRSGYSDQWERAISGNPEKSFSREDMYEIARVNKWKKSDFEYSNFGSALAGTMVAEVYGKEVVYQCFIGISPEKNKVVVVLSNGICNDKSETAYTDLLGYLLLSA